MRRLSSWIATAVVAAAAGGAHATTLTFSPFGSVQEIPQSYGDRVTVFAGDYGSEGGPTPNIVVDYVPTSTSAPFSNWLSGYGSLLSALGHSSFDVKGYVQLSPDPGFDVVLTSFQVGSWGASNYANSRILVTDTSGATLFDSGVFTFPGLTTLTYLPSPIRSSLPVRINIADYGDLGLDNVVFSQVVSIPEAEGWAMMLAGLGLVGWCARRRARARRA